MAGPPSSGKTTFLRDIARSLSLGRFASGRRVAIVDERGELGGFDLGPCADILRGYPKETGLEVALRTLSPEVIVCDELSQRDFKAVQGALVDLLQHQRLLDGAHDDHLPFPPFLPAGRFAARSAACCLIGKRCSKMCIRYRV